MNKPIDHRTPRIEPAWHTSAANKPNLRAARRFVWGIQDWKENQAAADPKPETPIDDEQCPGNEAMNDQKT
jgi:hypothetical protein